MEMVNQKKIEDYINTKAAVQSCSESFSKVYVSNC